MKVSPHYAQSTLRERIVEHVFLLDALRRLWQRKVTEVEVLRSEFDAGGYDLSCWLVAKLHAPRLV